MDAKPTLLRVYLDRLTDGRVEKVNESLPVEVMAPHEQEVRFLGPVEVEGQAYLAGSVLVADLTVKAQVALPCRVCNRDVELEVRAKETHSFEELEDHRDGVVDLVPAVRELIFLEMPQLAECAGGCVEREAMSRYLHKEKEEGEKYHPFADL